jgi:hypothetical protein
MIEFFGLQFPSGNTWTKNQVRHNFGTEGRGSVSSSFAQASAAAVAISFSANPLILSKE